MYAGLSGATQPKFYHYGTGAMGDPVTLSEVQMGELAKRISAELSEKWGPWPLEEQDHPGTYDQPSNGSGPERWVVSGMQRVRRTGGEEQRKEYLREEEEERKGGRNTHAGRREEGRKEGITQGGRGGGRKWVRRVKWGRRPTEVTWFFGL